VKLVTYYTGDYVNWLRRWEECAERSGLDYYAEHVKLGNDWRVNTTHKPQFIHKCMVRYDEPILWVDVDGYMVGRPELLEDAVDTHDFAAFVRSKPHRFPMQTGTLWFNNTPLAHALLSLWGEMEERNKKHRVPNEVILRPLLDMIPDLRVLRLPQSYCKIRVAPWEDGSTKAVIEHGSASCRASKNRKILKSPRERDAELARLTEESKKYNDFIAGMRRTS
jgi:hypothetical protein